MTAYPPSPARDLRLDFFRGLALTFIFVDHVPGSPLGEVTLRAWGFSDAAEMFVFLSGYAASLAYGRALGRAGAGAARAKVARRMGQIYLTHLGLLAAFIALVVAAAAALAQPFYLADMFVTPAVAAPGEALAAGLALAFQPAFMNILPMYLVVMALFALGLPLLVARPLVALGFSGGLYGLVQFTGINLPAYPAGIWYFNPFAWQFLFTVGAVLGGSPARAARLLPAPAVLVPLAVAIAVFAYVFVLTWSVPAIDARMPHWIEDLVYPLSKTDLSPWRILHFLAVAYLVSRLVAPRAAWLDGPLARPLVIMGQHSLAVFCAGTLLSFVGRVVIADIGDNALNQVLVNGGGLLAMLGVAWAMRRRRGAPGSARQPALRLELAE